MESGIPPFVGPQLRARGLASEYGFANHRPVEAAQILKRGPEVAGVSKTVKTDAASRRLGVNSHKDEASGPIEEQIRKHPSGFCPVYSTCSQCFFCASSRDTRWWNVPVLRRNVHSDVHFHSTGVGPAWSEERHMEGKVGTTGMTGRELGRTRKEAHFKGEGICQSRTAHVS